MESLLIVVQLLPDKPSRVCSWNESFKTCKPIRVHAGMFDTIVVPLTDYWCGQFKVFSERLTETIFRYKVFNCLKKLEAWAEGRTPRPEKGNVA